MFDRFFRKPAAPSAPDDAQLGTAAGRARLLRGLPRGRDRELLDRVDELLEDLGEQAESFGVDQALEAALALDETSREACDRLLAAYFRPHDPDHGSLALLERLSSHDARLGAVYSDLFVLVGARVPEALHGPVLLAAERYLAAWALHRRFARFRQRPLGKASWQQAHGVVTQLLAWRLLPEVAGDSAAVVRKYLNVLYEETVPWGNLTPPQLELAARVIERRNGLGWSRERGDAGTHVIDLSSGEGPRRCPQEGAAPAGRPTLRYLATAPLQRSVDRLSAALREGKRAPPWLEELALEPQAIQGALQTLSDYWSAEPPRRQSPREERYRPLLGAFGFDAVRELLAASEKVHKAVRDGGNAESGGSAGLFVSELNRDYAALAFGGRIEGASSLLPGTPVPGKVPGKGETALAALKLMESTIPNLVLEHWTEIDSSDTGIGVLVPAMLPRHAAGVLIAWRYEDDASWRLGVVRRVGRDGRDRPTLGIEVKSAAQPCVLKLLKAGSQARAAWKEAAQWLLAVMPGDGAGEGSIDVLLPAGSFVGEMPVSIIGAHGERHARMNRVAEAGGDWERVSLNCRN